MKTIKINSIILIFNFVNVLYGQDSDIKDKKQTAHFVYVTPSSIPGVFLDFNMFNYWAEAGYGVLINKSLINIDAGMLVYSYPTDPVNDFLNIGKQLHQVKSVGYNFGLEYKYNLKKRFYIGGYVYYNFMETIRDEKIVDDTPPYGKAEISQYKVNRHEIGFVLPKIGWAIIDKKRVSCEVSFGVGVRYISSKSIGKKDPSSKSGIELLKLKQFDDGISLMFKVLPHFRIGYAF